MPKRKLTEVQVHEICTLMKDGWGNKEIAEKFNVYCSTISQIRTGKIYNDIRSQYNINKKRKYSDETLHKISKMLEDGYKVSLISKETNVDVSSINRILYDDGIYTDITSQYDFKNRMMYARKYDDETIHIICGLMKRGYTNAEISKLFNISQQKLSKIRHGMIYRHVTKMYDMQKKTRVILKDNQIHDICKMITMGISDEEISFECGINKTTVYRIRRGETHKEISKLYNIKRCNSRVKK